MENRNASVGDLCYIDYNVDDVEPYWLQFMVIKLELNFKVSVAE